MPCNRGSDSAVDSASVFQSAHFVPSEYKKKLCVQWILGYLKLLFSVCTIKTPPVCVSSSIPSGISIAEFI